MTEYLKIGLDLLILAGLGGFMYYSLRLSRALKAFRANRSEFDGIMNQLNAHIEAAQKAVLDLKETSKVSGEDLHKLVREAQHMADELQLMNQAGDNLATRLESLAERNRRVAQGLDDGEEFLMDNNISDFPDKAKENAQLKPQKDEGFAIQDREFDEDEVEIETLSSAAERDLYKALKKAEK